MSGKMFQLTVTQLDWLSTHYPTVAHYTEGGGGVSGFLCARPS